MELRTTITSALMNQPLRKRTYLTMNRFPFLAVGAALLLGSGAAHAQLSMTWSTIDCGGGPCSAGVLTLSCTIGQPDGGPIMSGGALTLTGGFWAAAGPSGPH